MSLRPTDRRATLEAVRKAILENLDQGYEEGGSSATEDFRGIQSAKAQVSATIESLPASVCSPFAVSIPSVASQFNVPCTQSLVKSRARRL